MKQYRTEICLVFAIIFYVFSKEFDVYSSLLPTPIKPNPYVRMSLPEMMTLRIEFHLSG